MSEQSGHDRPLRLGGTGYVPIVCPGCKKQMVYTTSHGYVCACPDPNTNQKAGSNG